MHSIIKLEPSISNAICNILELEPSILLASCNIWEVEACIFVCQLDTYIYVQQFEAGSVHLASCLQLVIGCWLLFASC